MKYISMLICSGILVACATQPPALPSVASRVPMQPLQVQAQPEPFGLRVDVYRIPFGQDLTANDLNSVAPSAPSIDPSNYAWIGVNVGNGLFVDSNGNLSVDLSSLYQLPDQYQIDETVMGLVPYHIYFTRNGTHFRRTNGGTDLPDVNFTIGDASIDMNFPSAATQPTIIFGDGVIYDSHSVLNSGRLSLKQVNQHLVETSTLLGGADYILKSADEINLAGKFILKKQADELLITRTGSAMFSSLPPIRYTLTADGCSFVTGNQLYEIHKTENTITVSVNGKVKRIYQITLSSGTPQEPAKQANQ